MMNLLEFANPSGWWWAALALPIIGFYFLKVRLHLQPVSTLLFWDRVFDEKKPRAWLQQVRHWLSLLLQLALLLLLVAAVTDPLWSWQKQQQRKLVLVIDNSASMASDELGRSRLELAKETAVALIRSMRVGDEMAILTAGGKSTVAIGLTSHTRSLLTALHQIALTDAPGALQSAVATAKRLVPESDHTQVLVLTDGCEAAVKYLQQDPRVVLYGFGSANDNLAITQYQVRRSLLDAVGYQVMVEVSNLSNQPHSCRLELSLDDQLVDVVPLELEPGGSKIFNLDHSSAVGGHLLAQLDSSDGLSVDNRAVAVLPTRHKMPVTLATPGSLFLNNVLESIPLVELTVLDTLPMDWKPAQHEIAVLHQAMPVRLPAGKLLVINPGNNCDLWNVGTSLASPIVGSVDVASPITQHVQLNNVLFPEARELTFTGQSEALIKTPLDEPLLSHIRRPEGDVVVLNVNLDQGELPLRIAFPVLMKNVVEWFQGNQAELQPALATGQSTTLRLPDATPSLSSAISADALTDGSSNSGIMKIASANNGESNPVDFFLRSPSGKLTPLTHTDSTAALPSLLECGLWSIGTVAALQKNSWNSNSVKLDNAESSMTQTSDPNGEVVRLACNLCNLDESDLRPRTQLKRPNDFGMLQLGGSSIWFYLVLTGLVFAVVEWWLYQRRIVG